MRRPHRPQLIALCGLLLAIGSGVARGDTIATVFAQNSSTSSSPPSGNNSISASLTGASATVIASPDSTTEVDVVGATGGALTPQAAASLDYNFTVTGPGTVGVTMIIVDIDSSSSTFAEQALSGNYQGSSVGEAIAGLSGASAYFGFTQLCNPAPECVASHNSAAEIAFTVYLGETNDLDISSQALVQGSGEIYSSIDPVISVDPSTTNYQDYSITLSQNVGDPPSNPEPATGALALLTLVPLAWHFRKCVTGLARSGRGTASHP